MPNFTNRNLPKAPKGTDAHHVFAAEIKNFPTKEQIDAAKAAEHNVMFLNIAERDDCMVSPSGNMVKMTKDAAEARGYGPGGGQSSFRSSVDSKGNKHFTVPVALDYVDKIAQTASFTTVPGKDGKPDTTVACVDMEAFPERKNGKLTGNLVPQLDTMTAPAKPYNPELDAEMAEIRIEANRKWAREQAAKRSKIADMATPEAEGEMQADEAALPEA